MSKKIITTYSKALFQSVKNSSATKEDSTFNLSSIMIPNEEKEQKQASGNLFSVGEELSLLSSILKTSKNLNNLIKNPTYREQQKLTVLLNLFPGFTATTKAFLKVLTDRSHLLFLEQISEEYNSFLLKFEKTIKVKISVANRLEENYGVLLLETLKTLTGGNEIILDISYNPKLLGGLIIEYNSVAIDASLLKEFSLFFSDL